MSNEPSSMEKTFRDACGPVGAVLGVESDPEQLDMLRDPETGRLPTDVFRRMRVAAKERGPGRPAGSRNKQNEDLAKLICHKHGNPVLFMASIYSMPLDQLCELLLAAEGTSQREDALIELVEEMTATMRAARKAGTLSDDTVKNFTSMAESIETSATALKSKPGDIALKALSHQLAAANNTAPYVEKKQPVAVDYTVKADATIIMPADARGPMAPQGFDAVANNVVDALSNGTLRMEDLRDIKVVEGQILRDGVPIEDIDDDGSDR